MKILYYICFQTPEGSFPQRDTESFDKKKLQEECEKLNSQNANSYCNYYVASKVIYEKKKSK